MHQLYLYTALIFLLACNDQKEGFKSPPGYDLNKPEKFIMPEVLNEISGISFYGGNNDRIYAVQDEEGKMFYLRPGDKRAGATVFGKSGDYEDLSIINGYVFVLRSDGTIFSFQLEYIPVEETIYTKEWRDLVPKGEYEGLYADHETNKLYVLCKQCKKDKGGIYILQRQNADTISASDNVSIDLKAIEKLSGEKKLNFHPSALTKNPRTKEWYILSSANRMLVITDNAWNVKEVYRLDPALFRQPEGIAFDGDNNLYISNEGDNVSNGNVLRFVYNKTN